MSLIDTFLNQPEKQEDAIWRLHNEGLAPSQIASKLRVTPDVAHDEVVKRWKKDREEHIRGGR